MSYTNTSLSTARRCLQEFNLRYDQQLESVEDDSEALQVGTCWHHAFDVETKGGDPFEAIRAKAPSPCWAVKLTRMFAAYYWYWRDQKLAVIESERTFKFVHDGEDFEGQLDGVLEDDLKRRGLLERKTTSFAVDDDSPYWDKLQMDVQVGIYTLALDFVPSFTLYDVVRKPTINPKAIAKADVKRMAAEVAANGVALYFGEEVPADEFAQVVETGRETLEMYGSRLTADIGNRPAYYFARRPIYRTVDDLTTLKANLLKQVRMIEYARENDSMFRNPDACNVFGLCDYFKLCANNINPAPEGPVPEGFRKREHLHPELAQQPTKHDNKA